VETFARSGALSISDGAPRGAALAAVFVRVGLGGHISTKSAQPLTLPAGAPVQVLRLSALAQATLLAEAAASSAMICFIVRWSLKAQLRAGGTFLAPVALALGSAVPCAGRERAFLRSVEKRALWRNPNVVMLDFTTAVLRCRAAL
jgi:hypothetical protein